MGRIFDVKVFYQLGPVWARWLYQNISSATGFTTYF